MEQVHSKNARKHERVDLYTPGELILPGGFRQRVEVTNMSVRGAAVRMQTSTVVPERFTLEIQSLDGRKVKICECQRRWQKGASIGARFLSAHTKCLD